MAKVIHVEGGRYECPHCGVSFVGTWHGDKKDMYCPFCDKPWEPDPGPIELTEEWTGE